MKENLVKRITNFITQHKQKNRWKQVVTVMAALVVFATTYSLILPAITMTGTATGSNCETSSNAATGSNGGGFFGSNGFFTATGSNANAASGSNTLVQTPSDAILYRCGLDEHFHDDTCYDADDELICDFEEHEHVEQCYYPEEFTVEMIELMDIFASEIGKLPDLEVVNEYKILEAKELFDEADALLAEEMGINLEDGTLPYEVVEVMIGTALESYTAAMDLFIEEYPELTADDFGAILAGDYVYGPAYKTLLEFIEVWYGAVTLDAVNINTVEADVAEGVTVKLFNYDDTANTRTDGLGPAGYVFFHGDYIKADTDYNADSSVTNAKEGSVDGKGSGKNTYNTPQLQVSLVEGYPYVDGEKTDKTQVKGSLNYLFSDEITDSYHVATMEDGGGLFRKDADGYYYYDSSYNAATYDETSNSFMLYNMAISPPYTYKNVAFSDIYAGNFLPFNAITTETIRTAVSDINSSDVQVQTVTDTINGEAVSIPRYRLYKPVDLWFGMTVEFDFAMPKDGLVNGEPMIFDFHGDDDVFVYIDDKLVLDIGGTHAAFSGSINFNTGEISDPTTDETVAEGKYYKGQKSLKSIFELSGETFEDYSPHKLKFFYMERGGNISYCRLRFNIPILPDKSLTVTKELEPSTSTTVDTFIKDSLSYKFRVVKAADDGSGNLVATDELFIQPGTTYTLLEGGNAVGTGTVDMDGYFCLKADQGAQFRKMLDKGKGSKHYIVEEVMPDNLVSQYANVQYNVGSGLNSTLTDDTASQEFTTFQTSVLSAEATQTVIYRNNVDITKLGELQIKKVSAPGTILPEGAVFEMRVELDGNPIAEGTEYIVKKEGEEPVTKTVEDGGLIELKADETASIVKGIISGTTYEVLEINQTGYTPSYSGTVTSILDSTEVTGSVTCGANGASGTFPMASRVEVTVANADYNFSVDIPLYKTCLDITESKRFNFLIEKGTWDGTTWTKESEHPGTNINVTDANRKDGKITIGYKSGTNGVFQYKIYEKNDGGNFIYDSNFYIVDVTVANDIATITNIRENGEQNEAGSQDTIDFVNRKTTDLTVTKMVEGVATGAKDQSFPFKLMVILNGEAFNEIPQPTSEEYSVNGNEIIFDLKHNERVTIPHIPMNAVVRVEETNHDGFVAYYQMVNRDSDKVIGSATEVEFEDDPITVNFTNYAGQELPSTGGIGTFWCTFSGLLLVATAMMFGFVQKRRRERREN